MNTIISPQKGSTGNGWFLEGEIQEIMPPYHHEVNITDGGEFLDDNTRMKDQPFGEKMTDENE